MTPSATCAFSEAPVIPPHSAGKERDTESGNDYMFARYYNSATGRFLSPDWDAKSSDPVPYAKLDNPQSLNLYSYVGNNPVGRADADGHAPPDASEDLDLLDGKGSSPEEREQNRIETALEPVEYAPPPPILPPPTPLQQAVQLIYHGGPVEQAIEKTLPPLPPKVEAIIKQISEGGFKVIPNPKTPTQVGNVKITNPAEPGVELNLRDETHSLRGGKPVRHVNVQRIEPGAKNRPVRKTNKHITEENP